MKKLLSILCILTLSLSGVACGTTKPNSESNTPTKESTTKESTNKGETKAPTELAGEITISAYETMQYKEFLENTAKLFEAENPGTKINVSTFSAMPEIKKGENQAMIEFVDDTQSKKDYINKINTELMSGGGADLLAMDIIPFTKYADGGQLQDLQKQMDSDSSFNKSDYNQTVLNALKYKDGLYSLPLAYSFNLGLYNKSFFDEETLTQIKSKDSYTAEELINLAIKPFETVNKDAATHINMFNQRASDFFYTLLDENYTKFVDIAEKKVNINDGSFEALLEKCNEYADKGYLINANEPSNISFGGSGGIVGENSFYALYDAMLVSQMFTKEGQSGNDQVAGMKTNDKKDFAFTSYQSFAMNANSSNKDLAWAFMKFLVSEKMQSSPSVFGFPLNNNARTEKYKSLAKGDMFATGEKVELTAEQQEAFDSYSTTMENYASKLNTSVIRDTMVDQMIGAEVAYFFDGSKPAKEVAENLQNKISLYLSE